MCVCVCVLLLQVTIIFAHLFFQWADLTKSYLVEAKWYRSGYQPSLNEYLENARISIGGPVILIHAYFVLADSNHLDSVSFEEYHDIINFSSIILRLVNDLGTSKVS